MLYAVLRKYFSDGIVRPHFYGQESCLSTENILYVFVDLFLALIVYLNFQSFYLWDKGNSYGSR